MLLPGLRVWGQGVSSRHVAPAPRGKPSGLPFHAHFVDVAREAGLHAPVIYGGVERKDYILETLGCGIAFIDYDNDGWLDIFVLSGTRFSEPPQGATNRLYKNNRDGTFTDVTGKAGLSRSGWACGVCVGDFNNDGFEDLFITYYGHNVLYRNNGDGTFTDVTQRAGLWREDARWGTGCTFVDYDRDGHLDLFVSEYLDFQRDKIPPPGENSNCKWKGVPVNCGPRGLPYARCWLYHNNGDGTFSDVSERSGIAKAKGSYCLTAVAADFDSDGWPDIYVACDSSPSFLFHNNHDGTFTDVGLESGVALNSDGVEQAGMGVGIGDCALTGRLDIFKTHFADDTNVLYRSDGKGFFDDATLRSGLGVETRYVSWGAGIEDLDNDGVPDLLYVTGNVYPEIESKVPGYPLKTPRIVFRGLPRSGSSGEARFEELIEEAGPGIAAAHCSRGCAFGDFDNDGDVDVVVVNLNEPPSLLRNDVTGGGHWLKVKLKGVKSNRSAIGARIIARYGRAVQAKEVLSASSFLSANDPRLHFGLGSEDHADLEIWWPSGAREKLPRVKADRLITVVEGSGMVSEEAFGSSKPGKIR